MEPTQDPLSIPSGAGIIAFIVIKALELMMARSEKIRNKPEDQKPKRKAPRSDAEVAERMERLERQFDRSLEEERNMRRDLDECRRQQRADLERYWQEIEKLHQVISALEIELRRNRNGQ